MMRIDDFRARVAARAAFRTSNPRIKRLVRQQQPNAIRLAYTAALQPLLERMNELTQTRLVPLLPELVTAAGVVHDAEAHAGYWDKVSGTVEEMGRQLLEEFPTAKLQAIAAKFGERTSKHQRLELARQLRGSLSIDIEKAEPWLKPRLAAWAHENAQLIKSVPARYLGEIEQRTLQGLRTGERSEDIAKEYSARYGVSQSRARLIARDQIGKLNGQLNIARQKEAGIARWTWRTSEDERVRPEHELLDGKVFGIDDPPSEGFPGEPINCRCMAEPDVQSEINSLAGGSSGGGEEEPPSNGGGGGGGGSGPDGEPVSQWWPPGGDRGDQPAWLMRRGPPGTIQEHEPGADGRFKPGDMVFDGEKERQVARYLAAQGNDVVALHRENTQGVWPDAAVNGAQVEFTTVMSQHRRAGVATIRSRIRDKARDMDARAADTRSLIVDARGTGATERDAKSAATTADTRKLQFIRVIGDGFDFTYRAPG